jgi:hypothetical protein
MGFAGLVGALLALGAFVVTSTVLCHWLLGPVNRAAGHLNAPTRFQLTDFIWLMIQLQVVLAVVMQTVAEAMPQRAALIILGLLCLPVVVLWAASVSVVSRAGIRQPLRRAVVILLLVPGALAEVMALPLLVVAAIVLLSDNVPWAWQNRWTNDVVSRLWLILLIAAAIAAAGVTLRWLSHWVLAPARAAVASLKS